MHGQQYLVHRMVLGKEAAKIFFQAFIMTTERLQYAHGRGRVRDGRGHVEISPRSNDDQNAINE